MGYAGSARMGGLITGYGAVGGVIGRHTRFIKVVLDSLSWCIALTVGTIIRYNFSLDKRDYASLKVLLPIAVALQILSGLATGLYTGRWRFGSFEEVAALGEAAFVNTLLLFVIVVVASTTHLVPLGAVIVGGLGALVLMGGSRYAARLTMEKLAMMSGGDRSTKQRTIIFGAGEGAYQALTAIRRDPSSPYLPVALLDDDPSKAHLRLQGVRVRGSRSDLAAAARALGAKTLLIAIPSAARTLVAGLQAEAVALGLSVKVLPAVQDLYGDPVEVSDIRDITTGDLLGRQPVETDVASIAGYLAGKRVLVTGAGGSIGSELCRQIHAYGPAELVMLDRDESALHAVQLSIEGRALLDSPSLALADIRDEMALEAVFRQHRPEVVFHAAALKHLTLLERHPAEAMKSNVWGTANVLSAAEAHGVQRLVNISSDKAADPRCVLGYSKRLGERLTASMEGPGTYLSVRFGNVMNSRGSVLETFRSQIRSGGPVTVTHPDVTRYFMTIPEAVQLVIQAGAIGRPGEALVLEMGDPIRIQDVAHNMVERAGGGIEIVFTGLRPGEKMHEDLFGRGERDWRPIHPLIAQVPVPPLPFSALPPRSWANKVDPGSVIGVMRDLCNHGSLSSAKIARA